MHGTDADIELLKRTETSYQEYLVLTQNRYRGGVASDLDVAQAEAQLYGTQSTLIDLGVTRAQFEHAIAVLIGKAPSELTIPSAVLATLPPPVPIGVPSELLERRPDIAGSERRVAAANEQIGIAMAAFYPNLTLSASTGFQDSTLARVIAAPAGLWSIGGSLAQTLFDAGRRRAVVVSEQAAYDATVAAYRQTVLTALQQVEDSLAALRILEIEAAKVEQTVSSSDRALTVSTAQYRAGTASYLTVLTSQAVALTCRADGGRITGAPADVERPVDSGARRRMERVAAALHPDSQFDEVRTELRTNNCSLPTGAIQSEIVCDRVPRSRAHLPAPGSSGPRRSDARERGGSICPAFSTEE